MQSMESMLPDACVVSEVEVEEIGRLISNFLRTEKEEARNVFLRRYFFGDSISDIAKMYGFRVNTVKSMLFRSRSRLRVYLKKEGVSV